MTSRRLMVPMAHPWPCPENAWSSAPMPMPRLSHPMARELGMNPKKLGKLDNHDQEPWKLPLQEFIRKLYSKRFGKERPDAVRSIEEMVVTKQAKKRAKEGPAKASISSGPAA